MSTTTQGEQAIPPKDPSDVVDYAFSFAGEGLTATEAITGTPTVAVDAIGGDPSPLVVGAISLSGSPAQTINVFFSAGSAGNEYVVRITFVTNGARTFQRSFRLPVRDL